MHSLLFDARLLRPTPTGIGQYISSLLPELWRAAPDIHFHLLRPPRVFEGYGVERWIAPNLTQHIRSWRHMSIAQQWQIPMLARQLGADAIHYPHFDAPVWFSTVPTIATIHDAKYLEHAGLFPGMGQAKRAYMRYSFEMTLKRARRVITVSHATAEDLRARFEVPEGQLEVVYEAADPHIAPVSQAEYDNFRFRHGIARPYILSVGELRSHKNHDTLIRAYARSTAPTTHDLVIIGRLYGESNELVDIAATEGVAAYVRILTNVDHADLSAAYTGASLFVLLSLYEGFGLPILEAMACGVPVIASNTTATGEILGDGGVGVPPTDIPAIIAAMEHVLRDPEYAQALRERGATWQRQFSWQRAAEQTATIYREVLYS